MQEKLNTYIAFYKSKKIEVLADSSYHAQEQAAKQLKAKRSYEVTVMLAKLGDKEVTHVAVD